MEIISFDDFVKLEIRIGKILEAERVEGSDKLLKLKVDFGPLPTVPVIATSDVAQTEIGTSDVPITKESAGEEEPKREIRQIIAGIAKFYAPEALIGKECPFAYNLAPRKLKGLESQGMILCPSDNDGPVLLHPDQEVQPGSLIK